MLLYKVVRLMIDYINGIVILTKNPVFIHQNGFENVKNNKRIKRHCFRASKSKNLTPH